MKQVAAVTSKAQVTIPKEVRQRLGLKQGDQVSFDLEAGQTVLRPYRGEANPFEAYAGALGSVETRAEVSAWLDDLRNE